MQGQIDSSPVVSHRSAGPRRWQGLYRDPVVALAAAVVLLASAAAVLPLPAALGRGGSVLVLGQVLMALAVAAPLVGLRRIEHPEQRRFRRLFAGGMAAWMASSLFLRLPAADWTPLGHLLSDLFLVLSYLLLLLASALYPHRPAGWSRDGVAQRVGLGGAVVFVLGLALYFVFVPANFDASGQQLKRVSSFAVYVLFDLVLAVRFAALGWRCRGAVWRAIYGLLAFAAGLWALLDGSEALMFGGVLPYADFGALLVETLWNLPHLALIAALRLLDRPSLPLEAPPVEKPPETAWMLAGTSGLLMLYAFTFPALHLLLDAFGMVSEETRTARALSVLAVLLVLCAMAWLHHRDLLHRTQRLQAERKAAADRHLASQRLESVGRFANAIAHDFNNFLTAIGSYADLARQHAGQDASLRRYLREIERICDRAGELVRQLLTFGRAEPLNPIPLALNDVVGRFRSTLQQLTEAKEIALETRLDHGLWTIHGERSHLEQVLLNLVVNARDATPAQGTIEIVTKNVRRPGDDGSPAGRPMVMLEVRDTGEGIPPEKRALIFEPSFTTKKRGTGLGLATVYGIVKRCGGEIEVDSEVGVGTSFRLYFPAAVLGGALPERTRQTTAAGGAPDSP